MDLDLFPHALTLGQTLEYHPNDGYLPRRRLLVKVLRRTATLVEVVECGDPSKSHRITRRMAGSLFELTPEIEAWHAKQVRVSKVAGMLSKLHATTWSVDRLPEELFEALYKAAEIWGTLPPRD